eukprot:scaffold73152_cov30-Phaeocystis_antarctica.AAC.1
MSTGRHAPCPSPNSDSASSSHQPPNLACSSSPSFSSFPSLDTAAACGRGDSGAWACEGAERRCNLMFISTSVDMSRGKRTSTPTAEANRVATADGCGWRSAGELHASEIVSTHRQRRRSMETVYVHTLGTGRWYSSIGSSGKPAAQRR